MINKKHLEISKKVLDCYNIIKRAEEDLKFLRKRCDHPETKFVDYMWAPGHIMPNTEVCSVCGEVIHK